MLTIISLKFNSMQLLHAVGHVQHILTKTTFAELANHNENKLYYTPKIIHAFSTRCLYCNHLYKDKQKPSWLFVWQISTTEHKAQHNRSKQEEQIAQQSDHVRKILKIVYLSLANEITLQD